MIQSFLNSLESSIAPAVEDFYCYRDQIRGFSRYKFKSSYNCTILYGLQGRGKTLEMMRLLLDDCVFRRYGLMFNYDINLEQLYSYGHRYDKTRHICEIVDKNLVRSFPSKHQWSDLFSYPYSLVAFDEIGGKLDARQWAKKDGRDKVLEALRECRHKFVALYGTGQFPEQADTQIRRMCDRVIYCSALTLFDSDRSIDVLCWRSASYFRGQDFWQWWEDAERRLTKPVWSELKKLKSHWGLLTPRHFHLLRIYNSHGPVDGLPRLLPLVKTRHYCSLPSNYYLSNRRFLLPGVCPLTHKQYFPALTPSGFDWLPLDPSFLFPSDLPVLPFDVLQRVKSSRPFSLDGLPSANWSKISNDFINYLKPA